MNVSHVTTVSDVFALGLIYAELCVVMDNEYEKRMLFDSYRAGNQNKYDIDQKNGILHRSAH
ncbi:hypothetical protein PENTCL1PPCAC_8774 [Pristionchus entomophagus]|uniref:Serine-threonine/tyrosine-protein kinase catalytic domain-containing protein n=1 Tax=Pristionchus entomophagus TaxID=358040 RepID=A0AAV5SUQ4_9BILA|nr:hypothetical protein PENTCL1PPCAC_8774 [Pristionchus entomophagus]